MQFPVTPTSGASWRNILQPAGRFRLLQVLNEEMHSRCRAKLPWAASCAGALQTLCWHALAVSTADLLHLCHSSCAYNYAFHKNQRHPHRQHCKCGPGNHRWRPWVERKAKQHWASYVTYVLAPSGIQVGCMHGRRPFHYLLYHVWTSAAAVLQGQAIGNTCCRSCHRLLAPRWATRRVPSARRSALQLPAFTATSSPQQQPLSPFCNQSRKARRHAVAVAADVAVAVADEWLGASVHQQAGLRGVPVRGEPCFLRGSHSRCRFLSSLGAARSSNRTSTSCSSITIITTLLRRCWPAARTSIGPATTTACVRSAGGLLLRGP